MWLADFPVVIVGDLHGRCDLLQRALTAFGLMDSSGQWVGGSRRLVQLGDLIDRGSASLATLDLLMQLQPQAAAAGGEVTCLLGNHEAMALRAGAGCHAGRLQWALNGGWTVYREWLGRTEETGGDGGTRCDPGSSETEGTDLYRPPHPEAFYAIFGPDGYYGRWLRRLKLSTWVGEFVVVHAGWNGQSPPSVEAANRGYVDPGLDPLMALEQANHPLSNASPLIWARRQPEDEVVAACDQLGCRGLITGHTIQEGIRLSSGGRLVQIDVGMIRRDRWAAVALDRVGRLWAVIEGEEPTLLSTAREAEGPTLLSTAREGDGHPWLSGGREQLVPMPPSEGPSQAVPEPRFGPGTLLTLYRSAGDEYVQYYYIKSLDLDQGYPTYSGEWITASAENWSREERRRPAAWIDTFARAASVTALPDDLRADPFLYGLVSGPVNE